MSSIAAQVNGGFSVHKSDHHLRGVIGRGCRAWPVGHPEHGGCKATRCVCACHPFNNGAGVKHDA